MQKAVLRGKIRKKIRETVYFPKRWQYCISEVLYSMSNRFSKFKDSISGKGYYIALVLCAVAIGISGYLYYRSANRENPTLKNPTDAVDVMNPGNGTLPTGSVKPGTTHGNAQNPTTPSEPKPTSPTKPSEPAGKKPLKTGLPLTGETVAGYAMDCLSYNATTRDWRTHNGVDIAAENGTNVCAAADGVVESVQSDQTMGTTVVIRHDGDYVTTYSSLAAETAVAVGDSVRLGQTIGQVGETALLESALGAHLHFAVSCQGKPVDPAKFLGET